jgi:hypothetical protein
MLFFPEPSPLICAASLKAGPGLLVGTEASRGVALLSRSEHHLSSASAAALLRLPRP